MKIINLLVLSCAVAACANPTTTDLTPERPRILVVNDDGIDSPGLSELAAALAKLGEVVVCAPDGNRSGASHSSVAFSELLVVKEIQMKGTSYACSISGTPSDATSFGILNLGQDQPFDLVVSGINRGANVGKVAHYSGTVGAAMEANYLGVPSIATSQDSKMRDFSMSAYWTAQFAKSMLGNNPDKGICWSLNFPAKTDGAWKGFKKAPMGGSYIKIDGYKKLEDGYRAKLNFAGEHALGSDTEAYLDGWITITPLRFNWTENSLLDIDWFSATGHLGDSADH